MHQHNDLQHFLLNLAFLQFGWLDPIMSFNFPSWSLSIEAGLYAVFFVFACRFGTALRPRLIVGALCLALSTARSLLPLAGPLNVFFAEGLGCFFLGGCLQATEGFSDRRKLALGILLFALGIGLAVLTHGRRETTPIIFAGLVLSALGSKSFRYASGWPLLGWLGDISYSTYLWHMPIQIGLIVFSASVAPIPFSQPWAFGFYLFLVFMASTLSYRFFEAPARGWLRRLAAIERRPAPISWDTAARSDLAPAK